MSSERLGGAMVLSVQRDIASMKTRGAGEIGKQAALALAKAAEDYRGSNLQEFQRGLTEAAKLLASARPTAVSLRNGLNFVLGGAMNAKTVAEGRKQVRKLAQDFSKRVDDAKQKIAKLGASKLRPGEVILTHCHSTAALGVLIEAHKEGKHPRVFTTETRPFRQGLITSKALKAADVDVTLVVDSAALHVMETQGVTAVVIGADAISADGSLYNKIGTRLVTLAARSLGIPVYCCAETYKFSPYTLAGDDVEIEERDPAEVVATGELPGVKVFNPVFDRTPPDQITAYITDQGVLAPREVADFMRRQFGGEHRWL